MSPRTLFRPLAVAGVLAIALTACGGGSDPLTKAEFIKKADAICKGDDKAIEKLGATLGASPSDDEIQKALDGYVDIVKDQVKDLEDLEPPKSLKKDVDALLKSLDEGLDKMKDKGAELVKTGDNPLADASSKAQALGLKECGS